MTMNDQNTQDARLKKSADAGRENRNSSDASRKESDGTAYTAEQRRALFRNEWTQEALPKPPEIPGYHMCWLSTTNSYDPIHKRIRMGYEPVSMSEVPGFEHYKMQSGEYEGYVACNEMLLFKLPNDIYQAMMEELHYHAPLAEEEHMKANALLSQRDSNGKQLGMVEGEGFGSLGSKTAVPTFI
jgi:hypothetical protein